MPDPRPNVLKEVEDAWVELEVYECLNCKKTVTLLSHMTWIESDETGLTEHLTLREMVCPRRAPRELEAPVPEAIRSAYREASVCEQAGALRAASVMYRAAVEALVEERGASGLSLYHKIENLKTKGLDEDLVTDLHEARMLGNDSIHEGLEYSLEEVADVADLISEATVTLYVQPAERQRLRAARRARRSQPRKEP